MDKNKLQKTVKQMLKPGKGLLAADESNKSCKKRFDDVDVECTEELRRQYRQILISSPKIENFLSGIIFYEETFWQSTDNGELFHEYVANRGIVPGIKLDQGLIDLPGFAEEKISQGLDNLPDRIKPFAQVGAGFAKWRSVITIGEKIPTNQCIEANAFVLARYARICQDNNIVPIVEPEVFHEGKHNITTCQDVLIKTLDSLFSVLKYFRVYIPGVILKTSMVLPGKESGIVIDYNDVANMTTSVLHKHAPKELGGIVFLSGGQSSKDAFINLNRIKQKPHPWPVTFSYSRAIQDPVLKTWAKNIDNKQKVEDVYINQLELAKAATLGKLDESYDGDLFVSKSQDV